MMPQTAIIHNIQELLKTLPEPLQIEALHYVEYLSSRYVHQGTQQETLKKRGGFGIWKEKIWMADDFDAPLEEFEE